MTIVGTTRPADTTLTFLVMDTLILTGHPQTCSALTSRIRDRANHMTPCPFGPDDEPLYDRVLAELQALQRAGRVIRLPAPRDRPSKRRPLWAPARGRRAA